MFTQEQINELLKNKNVCKCSSTSISYSKIFKVTAIKKYYEDGCSPNMIFREAGFDLEVIGENKPKDCLSRWRKKYNSKGEKGLLEDDRNMSGGGRKKKMHFKSKDEEIEYLKAKISYMDAENDFLAKLRGLKRE